MTAAEILADAAADGLLLALDATGRLTVAGSAAARDQWRFELVTQKDEIIDLLLSSQTPRDWRELAAEYHLHHFTCKTCQAAGRGSQYGLRCGTGSALWTNYQNQI